MLSTRITLIICSLFFVQNLLNAQVTNGDRINFYTEIYRLKWNVNTESGNEEPAWRWKWRTTSAYTSGCSDSNYADNWCYEGNNTNNNYPQRAIYDRTNQPDNIIVYTANFSHENDAAPNCSYNSIIVASDEYGGCSYRQFTVKGGNPSQFRTVNYTGYNSWSEGGLRFIWRYLRGNSISDALDFGTPVNGQWYNHQNSNRSTPISSRPTLGYTNQAGNASPDVYYKFTIPVARRILASTYYGTTNFDNVLRLLDANGNELAVDGIDNGENQAQILKELCAGTYYVMVEGNGSASGDFRLELNTTDLQNTTGGTIALSGSDIIPVPQEEALSQLTSESDAQLLDVNNDASLTWETRIPNGTWETIPDANAQSYQLPELTENKEFRRVATGSCGQLEYSNVISIQTVVPNGILRGRVVSPTGSGVLGATICASRN
ncbi:MAG: hypothetical protein AB8G22_23250, partial [Saprospiraceae bacterium]